MFPYIWQAISTHPFNALTLVIALLAAIFTGLQAIEARKARRASEESLKSQADALAGQMELLKQQALASQRSAEAAEASAKIVHDFSVTGQRAWLTCDTFEAVIGPGNIPKFVTVYVKNGGLTPARIMDTYIFADKNLANDFEPPIMIGTDFGAVSFPGPLGPGSVTKVCLSIGTTPTDEEMLKKPGNLFVYGRVRYLDVFHVAHKLVWRLMYWPTDKLLFPDTFGNSSD